MSKNKKKRWTETEELELDHLYSSLHWSIERLTKKFSCTQSEIRRKVREMGSGQ